MKRPSVPTQLAIIAAARGAYVGHAWHARPDGHVWVQANSARALARRGLVEIGPPTDGWPFEEQTIILTEKGREACRVSSS